MLKEWNGKELIKAVRRATDKALVKVSSMIVTDAQDRCPVGVTGQLARSIGFDRPRTAGGRRFIEIGFTGGKRRGDDFFRYAMAMERGRAPGKRPPPGSLDLWVKRKLGIGDPKEIRQVAYLIGRAIGRRGIKGRHFMYRAFARYARHLPAQVAKYHREIIKGLFK